MTKLLDFRTSQNATYAESFLLLMTEEESVMIGQVGLNIVNPGANIRVDLSAMACIQIAGETGTSLTMSIVRGTLATDPLAFSSILSEPPPPVEAPSPTIVELIAEGSDYNVPAPASGLLVYTVFIVSSGPNSIRVGPESFKATAYSD